MPGFGRIRTEGNSIREVRGSWRLRVVAAVCFLGLTCANRSGWQLKANGEGIRASAHGANGSSSWSVRVCRPVNRAGMVAQELAGGWAPRREDAWSSLAKDDGGKCLMNCDLASDQQGESRGRGPGGMGRREIRQSFSWIWIFLALRSGLGRFRTDRLLHRNQPLRKSGRCGLC